MALPLWYMMVFFCGVVSSLPLSLRFGHATAIASWCPRVVLFVVGCALLIRSVSWMWHSAHSDTDVAVGLSWPCTQILLCQPYVACCMTSTVLVHKFYSEPSFSHDVSLSEVIHHCVDCLVRVLFAAPSLTRCPQYIFHCRCHSCIPAASSL